MMQTSVFMDFFVIDNSFLEKLDHFLLQYVSKMVTAAMIAVELTI